MLDFVNAALFSKSGCWWNTETFLAEIKMHSADNNK